MCPPLQLAMVAEGEKKEAIASVKWGKLGIEEDAEGEVDAEDAR